MQDLRAQRLTVRTIYIHYTRLRASDASENDKIFTKIFSLKNMHRKICRILFFQNYILYGTMQ